MANNETKRPPVVPRQRGYSDPKSNPSDTSRVTMKPKMVQVIRNGPHKPRTVVKALLNKRTAQNLEQVLDDISNSIGNTGGLSAPRKLYTISGQHIRDVAELFRDENNIFIAVGSEKFSPDDIAEMMEDLEQGSSKKQHAKRKQSRSGNEGMLHSKQRKAKEHEQTKPVGKSINTGDESKLPKLPDIHAKVESKPRAENNRVRVQSNSHAIKRSPQGKHTRAKATEKRPANSVKLPQIGNANLVTKSGKENKESGVFSQLDNEENQNANDEINESENDNNNQYKVQPGEVSKPSRKDSVSKKHGLDKIHKKTSRDDSGILSEDEVKYGTVTDKSVEEVYDMGRKIGDGNFADVRQCIDKITKKEFALKIVDKAKIRGKEDMIRDEIDIMRRCKHPNIVRMYEDYDSTRHIYLVMELIRGGDLFDAISSSVKFTEAVTRTYVKDIAKSLAYLHKRKIVHRDLKPENLLVHKKTQRSGDPETGRFWFSHGVKSPIFTVCGTPTYVAPEILEETGYGLKVDMWGSGCHHIYHALAVSRHSAAPRKIKMNCSI
ncbi:Serine/threonine-protein kinase dclk3 [Desmophyllum pertusum]|uniref:non-specific serine/threonine protein kinase n=1 Tax=Desmophyllum pertusum TaxID=174260 RepID=A0A9X0D8Z8_9CNID|nr:Serine/threonine-protein kinase dclk3 [Desmophyllum pertusum]